MIEFIVFVLFCMSLVCGIYYGNDLLHKYVYTNMACLSTNKHHHFLNSIFAKSNRSKTYSDIFDGVVCLLFPRRYQLLA